MDKTLAFVEKLFIQLGALADELVKHCSSQPLIPVSVSVFAVVIVVAIILWMAHSRSISDCPSDSASNEVNAYPCLLFLPNVDRFRRYVYKTFTCQNRWKRQLLDREVKQGPL